MLKLVAIAQQVTPTVPTDDVIGLRPLVNKQRVYYTYLAFVILGYMPHPVDTKAASYLTTPCKA